MLLLQADFFYKTRDVYVVGAVVQQGDHFASSLFSSNTRINSIMASQGIEPRDWLDKLKVLLKCASYLLSELPWPLTYCDKGGCPWSINTHSSF